MTFTTNVPTPTGANVVSEESGFGFSGVSYSNQGLELPAGWSVEFPHLPYFTLQFRDSPTRVRPLTLPATLDELPTDVMNLIVDFQQPVTIDGQTFGGRVYINGTITGLIPPPRDVGLKIDPDKIQLNQKNPKALKGTVYGAADFDVQDIDPATIGLGDPVLTDPDVGTGDTVAPTSIRYTDANRDGRLDLVMTFSLGALEQSGGIDANTTELEFGALLDDLSVVYGTDSVTVQTPKPKKKSGK